MNNTMRLRPKIQILILALSMVLLTIGVIRGEPWRIMEFAIFICLECIGIG